MGKNTNLIPSLLVLNKHKQIWLWPSCRTNHPKTLSFRATTDHHKDSFIEPEVEVTTLGSCFTNSSESASISTDNECSSVETIVRGARSQRLFFEPDSSSSILDTHGSSGRKCEMEKSGDGGVLAYKESVVVAMESENPYGDFKKSMEEMVESHKLKDWECLEELLGWYLRMNGKNNHDFILGAFVDLICGVSGGGGDGGVSCLGHSTASFTSAASNFSSPGSSPLCHVGRKKITREEKTVTK